jgi:hypothetical protein
MTTRVSNMGLPLRLLCLLTMSQLIFIFDLIVRNLVKWAHFDANRAAVVIAEIGEAVLVDHIGVATVFKLFPISVSFWPEIVYI